MADTTTQQPVRHPQTGQFHPVGEPAVTRLAAADLKAPARFDRPPLAEGHARPSVIVPPAEPRITSMEGRAHG